MLIRRGLSWISGSAPSLTIRSASPRWNGPGKGL